MVQAGESSHQSQRLKGPAHPFREASTYSINASLAWLAAHSFPQCLVFQSVIRFSDFLTTPSPRALSARRTTRQRSSRFKAGCQAGPTRRLRRRRNLAQLRGWPGVPQGGKHPLVARACSCARHRFENHGA